jgi:hypothetical protein
MQFLSISEDFPMPRRSEISNESTMETFRWVNGSFAAGSLVSLTAKPESEKVPPTSAIYGLSVRECLGSYDPRSHSLRTSQGSLAMTEGDFSTEFLAILPRQGMMRSGKLYRLSTSERRTSGSESGLWPTPKSSDGEKGGPNQRDSAGNYALPGAVHHWPTPRAHESGDYTRDRGQKGQERLSLTGAAKLWPTPTAMNDTGGPALCKWGGSGSREKMKSMTTPEELNGSLNPEFVEYLMGYPKEWTDLKESGIQLSLKSPR